MRAKKVENYFMILNGFAYDPFIKDNIKYIRVTSTENNNLTAIHLYENLQLLSSSMPNMINCYISDLIRNKGLIGGGFNA